MKNLQRWERLWALNDDLKPDGLQRREHDGLSAWTVDLDGVEAAEEHDAADDWKREEDRIVELPVASIIPAQVAEAMIRDRAMFWLVAHDYEPMLFNAMTGGIENGRSVERVVQWSVMLDPMSKDGGVEFFGFDPTEALYLACCHVLGVEPEREEASR
jgi:hypothetical protein